MSEPVSVVTRQQISDHVSPGSHCSQCGCGQTDEALTKCPFCGGQLIVEAAQAATDDLGHVSLVLVFARVHCDACGETTALRRDRRCAVCGEALTGEAATIPDPAVKARREAFKGRLARLTKRVQEAGLAEPRFTRKGMPLSVADHLKVLRGAMDRSQDLTSALRADLGAVAWDVRAQEPDCLPSFQRVVGGLDQTIDLVSDLANKLPPVELRAAHRILTRAIAQTVRGYLAMARTLTAPDPETALAEKNKGQALFGEAAAIMGQLNRLLDQISNQPSDSAWMAHDVLDFATVAWQGVGNRPTTISGAADVVRAALSTIPGIDRLGDAYALQLLPATVLGLRVADPALLAKRAVLMRSVLDDADRRASDWIADPSELVVRVSTGVRTVIELAERVGFASLGAQSRRMTLQLLVDVYRSLVEGPLRDLGGVLVIASRAQSDANGSYEISTARGVQAGDVVQVLERIGGPWKHAVEMVFRNAGAHGGAVVTEKGVAMTQRSIEGRVLVDETTVELTDGEFTEEFASLQETVLALQLGIYPWLVTHPDPRIAAAIAAVQPTDRDREAIVRLLAGLGGVLDLSFEYEGTAIVISGRLAESARADDPPKVPSLVPAIFGAWQSIDEVTIALAPKDRISFSRTELPRGGSGEDLPAVGLIGRRWLGSLPSEAALRADLMYLVKPQLNAIMTALSKSMPPTTSSAMEAETDMRALAERLDRADLPKAATGLVNEASRLVRETARELARFRVAVAGSDPRLRVSRAQALADLARRVGNADRKATQMWKKLATKASG
jgi:hypothetical protein